MGKRRHAILSIISFLFHNLRPVSVGLELILLSLIYKNLFFSYEFEYYFMVVRLIHNWKSKNMNEINYMLYFLKAKKTAGSFSKDRGFLCYGQNTNILHPFAIFMKIVNTILDVSRKSVSETNVFQCYLTFSWTCK